MRCRFSSFVVDLQKFCNKTYEKIHIVYYTRVDLFRVRVFFCNPMGVV